MSGSVASVLTIPFGNHSFFSPFRLKELRLENRARRKLRKEQEDYLQQQLTTSDETSMAQLAPEMATVHESDSESDVFSLSGRLDDTEMESMASKVRMQPPPPPTVSKPVFVILSCNISVVFSKHHH